MNPARFLAALAFSLTQCVAAFADYSLSPAHPTAADMVFLETTVSEKDPLRTSVSMAGNHIRVDLASYGVSLGAPALPIRVQLGRFPEGTYQLDVFSDNGLAWLGAATFDVAPRPAGLSADDFSDIWWDPAESGWGLNVIQHADGMIFATLFVYDADGAPVWYVIPGGRWNGPRFFEGKIYRTTGPVLTTAAFATSQVVVTPVGTATLLFGSSSQLNAALTIDGKTVMKQLQRESF